jgi:tetraacyldisaccharide-1-P 4'-kinase
MLESLQPAALQQLIFPDHHRYNAADYKTINNFGDAADFIITTEKDIAKMDFNMIHSNKLTALEIGLAIEREEELFQHLYQVCGKDLG